MKETLPRLPLQILQISAINPAVNRNKDMQRQTLRSGLLLLVGILFLSPSHAWAHAIPQGHSHWSAGLAHVLTSWNHLLPFLAMGILTGMAARYQKRSAWFCGIVFVAVLSLLHQATANFFTVGIGFTLGSCAMLLTGFACYRLAPPVPLPLTIRVVGCMAIAVGIGFFF